MERGNGRVSRRTQQQRPTYLLKFLLIMLMLLAQLASGVDEGCITQGILDATARCRAVSSSVDKLALALVLSRTLTRCSQPTANVQHVRMWLPNFIGRARGLQTVADQLESDAAMLLLGTTTVLPPMAYRLEVALEAYQWAMQPVLDVQAAAGGNAGSSNGSSTADISAAGWLMDPGATVDMDTLGGLVDLSRMPKYDAVLLSGVHPYVLEATSLYKQRVMGIPLSGSMLMMFARRDVLAGLGRQLPQTWAELIAAAAAAHGLDTDGDGQPEAGICLTDQPACSGSIIVAAILGSMVQTGGSAAGAFFDSSMRLVMGNTSAMERALDTYLQLSRYMPPAVANATCNPFSYQFARGQCAFTLQFASQFKANRLVGKLRLDQVVSSILPGSSDVWDEWTDTLLPCTQARCPLATPHPGPGLHTLLVNRAPYGALGGGIVGAIHARASPEAQLYAYTLWVALARPNTSWVQILDPAAPEFMPYRLEHLDHANLYRWEAAGWSAAATAEWLTAISDSYSHRNAMLDLKVAGFLVARRNMTITIARGMALGHTAGQIRSSIATALDAIWPLSRRAADYSTYLAGLGRQPTPSPNPPPATETQSPGEVSHSHRMREVEIGVPVAGASVVIAAALLLVLRHVRARGTQHGLGSRTTQRDKKEGILESLLHRVFAYQKGIDVQAVLQSPGLTLITTDIQNSTQLWEMLDPLVMDKAIKLHHKVIRSLMVGHGVYESATEGDAFIAAARDALSATEFAMDVQAGLLDASWPKELVASDPCCWPVWVRQFSERDRRMLELGAGDEGLGASAAPQAGAELARRPRHSIADEGDMVAAAGSADVRMTPGLPARTSVSELLPDDPSGPSGIRTSRFRAHVGSTQGSVNLVAPSGLSFASIEALVRRRRGADQASSQVTPPSVAIGPGAGAGASSVAAEVFSTFAARLQHTVGHGMTADQLGVEAGPKALVFRGLRVRIGIHTCPGFNTDKDVQYNPASKRYTFTGQGLAVARAIGDVGSGGQVLLSHHAFQALPESFLLRTACRIWHMGHFAFDAGVPKMAVYSAQPLRLLARHALMPPLRKVHQVHAGIMDAPLQGATLGVIQMPAAGTLMAWNEGVTVLALRMYEACVQHELSARGGYLADAGVIAATGTMVAAFSEPRAAVLWGIHCVEALRHLPWPEEILRHELCARVYTEARASSSEAPIAMAGPVGKAKVVVDLLSKMGARFSTTPARGSATGKAKPSKSKTFNLGSRREKPSSMSGAADTGVRMDGGEQQQWEPEDLSLRLRAKSVTFTGAAALLRFQELRERGSGVRGSSEYAASAAHGDGAQASRGDDRSFLLPCHASAGSPGHGQYTADVLRSCDVTISSGGDFLMDSTRGPTLAHPLYTAKSPYAGRASLEAVPSPQQLPLTGGLLGPSTSSTDAQPMGSGRPGGPFTYQLTATPSSSRDRDMNGSREAMGSCGTASPMLPSPLNLSPSLLSPRAVSPCAASLQLGAPSAREGSSCRALGGVQLAEPLSRSRSLRSAQVTWSDMPLAEGAAVGGEGGSSRSVTGRMRPEPGAGGARHNFQQHLPEMQVQVSGGNASCSPQEGLGIKGRHAAGNRPGSAAVLAARTLDGWANEGGAGHQRPSSSEEDLLASLEFSLAAPCRSGTLGSSSVASLSSHALHMQLGAGVAAAGHSSGPTHTHTPQPHQLSPASEEQQQQQQQDRQHRERTVELAQSSSGAGVSHSPPARSPSEGMRPSHNSGLTPAALVTGSSGHGNCTGHMSRLSSGTSQSTIDDLITQLSTPTGPSPVVGHIPVQPAALASSSSTGLGVAASRVQSTALSPVAEMEGSQRQAPSDWQQERPAKGDRVESADGPMVRSAAGTMTDGSQSQVLGAAALSRADADPSAAAVASSTRPASSAAASILPAEQGAVVSPGHLSRQAAVGQVEVQVHRSHGTQAQYAQAPGHHEASQYQAQWLANSFDVSHQPRGPEHQGLGPLRPRVAGTASQVQDEVLFGSVVDLETGEILPARHISNLSGRPPASNEHGPPRPRCQVEFSTCVTRERAGSVPVSAEASGRLSPATTSPAPRPAPRPILRRSKTGLSLARASSDADPALATASLARGRSCRLEPHHTIMPHVSPGLPFMADSQPTRGTASLNQVWDSLAAPTDLERTLVAAPVVQLNCQGQLVDTAAPGHSSQLSGSRHPQGAQVLPFTGLGLGGGAAPTMPPDAAPPTLARTSRQLSVSDSGAAQLRAFAAEAAAAANGEGGHPALQRNAKSFTGNELLSRRRGRSRSVEFSPADRDRYMASAGDGVVHNPSPKTRRTSVLALMDMVDLDGPLSSLAQKPSKFQRLKLSLGMLAPGNMALGSPTGSPSTARWQSQSTAVRDAVYLPVEQDAVAAGLSPTPSTPGGTPKSTTRLRALADMFGGTSRRASMDTALTPGKAVGFRPGAISAHASSEMASVRAQARDSSGTPAPPAAKVLVFRGPRVRVALDTGLSIRLGVKTATGRLQYKGKLVTRLGKAVANAASGQVVVTEDVALAVQFEKMERGGRGSVRRGSSARYSGGGDHLSSSRSICLPEAGLDGEEEENDDAVQLKFIKVAGSTAERAQLYEASKASNTFVAAAVHNRPSHTTASERSSTSQPLHSGGIPSIVERSDRMQRSRLGSSQCMAPLAASQPLPTLLAVGYTSGDWRGGAIPVTVAGPAVLPMPSEAPALPGAIPVASQ